MLDAVTFSSADSALLELGQNLRAIGYSFITPTPATHARVNGRPENAWAGGVRDVFGWSRPFRSGVLPEGIFGAMQQANIVEPFQDGWRSTLRLSSLGGDVFWHSAFPTSAPDAVFFGPDTYRFVHAALAEAGPVGRAVDVCSGAGPGAIALARLRPAAEVLMADINDNALRLSSVNARLAGVADRVTAHRSNLLGGVEGAFDLVIANPPYLLDPAERTYRHGGGSLGAGLSLAIIDAALDRLVPGGTLVLYTGVAIVDGHDAFHTDAAACLDACGANWAYREIDPDVFGEELTDGVYATADRIAAVLLTATKRR